MLLSVAPPLSLESAIVRCFSSASSTVPKARLSEFVFV
jgi:hypothetical protein